MIWRLGELWLGSPAAFLLALAASVHFVVAGVRLSQVDIREHRLPDRMLFPGYVVAGLLLGAAAAAAAEWDDLLRIVLAGAALWLFYFALRFVYPPGMGYGDVKLAGWLGLHLGYLSWGHALLGSAIGFILAGGSGVWLILRRRGTLTTRVPFGPYMIAGAAAVMAFLPAPLS